jgi:RNA polymerase sigma factor (sigma-70 family)
MTRDVFNIALSNLCSYKTTKGIKTVLTLYNFLLQQKNKGNNNTAHAILLDIDKALADSRLTDKEAQCINLYFFDRLTQTDIASNMEISQVRVSTLLSSALKKITKTIGGEL